MNTPPQDGVVISSLDAVVTFRYHKRFIQWCGTEIREFELTLGTSINGHAVSSPDDVPGHGGSGPGSWQYLAWDFLGTGAASANVPVGSVGSGAASVTVSGVDVVQAIGPITRSEPELQFELSFHGEGTGAGGVQITTIQDTHGACP
jgi:hypothetical protein